MLFLAAERIQATRVRGAPKATRTVPDELLVQRSPNRRALQQNDKNNGNNNNNKNNGNNNNNNNAKTATEAPSPAPTSRPTTSHPTVSPTPSPVLSPTNNPTQAPIVVERTNVAPTMAPTTGRTSPVQIPATAAPIAPTLAPVAPTGMRPIYASDPPTATPTMVPTYPSGQVPLLDFTLVLSSSETINVDELTTVLQDYLRVGIILDQDVQSIHLDLREQPVTATAMEYTFGGTAHFRSATPEFSSVHAEQTDLLAQDALLQNVLQQALGMDLVVEDIYVGDEQETNDEDDEARSISLGSDGSDSDNSSIILGSVVGFVAISMMGGLVFYRYHKVKSSRN